MEIWTRISSLFCFLLVCASLCYTQTTVPQRYRGNKNRNSISTNLDLFSNELNLTTWRMDYPSMYKGRSLQFFFNLRGFPNFSVSRYNEATSEISGINFRFVLVSFIEYIENSNSSSVGLDEYDTVVNVIPFYGSTIVKHFDQFHDVSDDIEYYVYILDSGALIDSVPLIQLIFGLSDLRGWVGAFNASFSPDTLVIQFRVNNYPFKNSKSRLALKGFLETPTPLFVRNSIPFDQRDDLNFDLNDALFSLSPSEISQVSPQDRTDQGYLCWGSNLANFVPIFTDFQPKVSLVYNFNTSTDFQALFETNTSLEIMNNKEFLSTTKLQKNLLLFLCN